MVLVRALFARAALYFRAGAYKLWPTVVRWLHWLLALGRLAGGNASGGTTLWRRWLKRRAQYAPLRKQLRVVKLHWHRQLRR